MRTAVALSICVAATAADCGQAPATGRPRPPASTLVTATADDCVRGCPGYVAGSFKMLA